MQDSAIPAREQSRSGASVSGAVQRAQGCLMGQLAGDALGSMVEFMPAVEIRLHYPDGLRVIGPSPVHHTLAGQL